MQPGRCGLIRKLTELLNFQNKVYRKDGFLQTEKGAATWQEEGQHMAEERKDMHGDCRSSANLYWIECYMVGILQEIAVELQGKIRSQTWQYKVGERKEKWEQWSRRVWMMYIPERIETAEWYWKKTFFLWFWEHVHSHFLLDIKNEQKSCA